MSDEKVGYKKPPKKNQFKDGQSGNPRGRPKALPDQDQNQDPEKIVDLVFFQEKLLITDKKGQREISGMEGICRRLLQMALAGDPIAIREVLKLMGQVKGKDFLRQKVALPWNDDDGGTIFHSTSLPKEALLIPGGADEPESECKAGGAGAADDGRD